MISQLLNVGDPVRFASTVLGGLLVLYIVYEYFIKRRNLPPGPMGWPIVGYLPYMTDDWHLDFKKLGEKYGSVFSLYLGRSLVIVLNDYRSISEGIVKNPRAFAGRPFSYGFQQMNCSPETLFKDTFTPTFKQRKKFAMAGLRGHGLMSQHMVHEKIRNEVQLAIDALKEHLNKPIKLRHYINLPGANIIASLFFNRTYPIGDEHFMNVLDWTNDWFTAMVVLCEGDVVPFYRFFQKDAVVKKGRRGTAKLREYFLGFIDEHRKSFDEENPTDFIDLAIKNKYDDEEILIQLYSLWGDAADTTPSAIRWWLYFVSRQPAVQKRIQDEIDEFVGTDRNPVMADKYNLVYLEATFMEAMRLASPVPVALPLMTTEKSKVCGYTIPNNTHYFANWYYLHTDPKVWGDPEVFRPERFFDDKGEFMDRHAAFLPFGAGKRNCIGEPIARDIVFLFSVMLMQHFTFDVPGEYVKGKNSLEERDNLAVTGVTNTPIDFAVIIKQRGEE